MVNKLRLYSVCNSSGFLFIYGIKYYEFKSLLYVSYAVETQYMKISYGHETEEIDTNIQYPKRLTRLLKLEIEFPLLFLFSPGIHIGDWWIH